MLGRNWNAAETIVRFMTGDINWQLPDVAYDYSSFFWLREIGKVISGEDHYSRNYLC